MYFYNHIRLVGGRLITWWFSFFHFEECFHVKNYASCCIIFILTSCDNYVVSEIDIKSKFSPSLRTIVVVGKDDSRGWGGRTWHTVNCPGPWHTQFFVIPVYTIKFKLIISLPFQPQIDVKFVCLQVFDIPDALACSILTTEHHRNQFFFLLWSECTN